MRGKFDGVYMNHPANKNDERYEKSILIEKPSKRAGTRVKGAVKTQLEIVEVEKPQSVLTDTLYIV